MPLTPCPECQKQISTEARACPYCGFRISRPSLLKIIGGSEDATGLIIASIFVVALMVFIFGVGLWWTLRFRF